MSTRAAQADAAEPDLWRALASPWRRRLLDLLRDAPATTGALASQLPELSRFAVMQHLGVLPTQASWLSSAVAGTVSTISTRSRCGSGTSAGCSRWLTPARPA